MKLEQHHTTTPQILKIGLEIVFTTVLSDVKTYAIMPYNTLFPY